MRYIEIELRKLMNNHLRTGSLKARRLERDRLAILVNHIAERNTGVKTLKNLGRRQIYEFYDELKASGAAPTTIYKYGLAVRKLWQALEFAGEAPMPKNDC